MPLDTDVEVAARSAAPEEAKTKPCHHGWCGAPFYSPECGPHESDAELVERTSELEEAKTKPCHHGWCGAPFCSPECGPHGSEEALAERAADDAFTNDGGAYKEARILN